MIVTASFLDDFYPSLSEDENLETITLIWLDSKVTKPAEKLKTQQKFRSAINHIKTFDTTDECETYIQHLSKDDRVVFITSGQMGKEFVPSIHHFRQITSIYIFCMDKKKTETWSKAFIKVNTFHSHDKMTHK